MDEKALDMKKERDDSFLIIAGVLEKLFLGVSPQKARELFIILKAFSEESLRILQKVED